MKKNYLLLISILCCITACAQKPSISILGDSYSTFEGYTKNDFITIKIIYKKL